MFFLYMERKNDCANYRYFPDIKHMFSALLYLCWFCISRLAISFSGITQGIAAPWGIATESHMYSTEMLIQQQQNKAKQNHTHITWGILYVLASNQSGTTLYAITVLYVRKQSALPFAFKTWFRDILRIMVYETTLIQPRSDDHNIHRVPV